MNLHLSLFFLFCIIAGSSGESRDQTKLNDGKIAERRLHWPHHTRGTLPYHVQSDQAVPKKKISKVNRRKFLQNLKEEKKLKRTLQDIAKQRLHVQKLIQQEQQKLVDLQTKLRRVIKTTPKLRRLEARDRKLIARENSLRGEIQVVQKKYCSDCNTTTKRTDAVETTKSTSPGITTPSFLPRKTMESVFPEPTKPSTPMTTEKTRRTRKPSNKITRPNGKAKGQTTRPITEGMPSDLLTSSAKFPVPTMPSTLTTTEPLLTYSAKTLPLTTIIPSRAPLPSKLSTSRRTVTTGETTLTSTPLVKGKTDSSLNTVMPLKTTLALTTPTIPLIVTTYMEPTSTLRTTMLRKYRFSTTPVTIQHSTAVSTNTEAVSTPRSLEPSKFKFSTILETVDHSTTEPSTSKFSSTPTTAETILTTETRADANMKTTVPWKYTVNPTQTKIEMPVDVPEHSTHAMTEDWSATMATTELITKIFLTTKPDLRKYYTTTNPVSRSKAKNSSPAPVPVFTTKRIVVSRIESTPTATSKQALFTPTTGSSNTDSGEVKTRNNISNTRGQSVSSDVDSHSKSEKEAVVTYVSVAVSIVGVIVIIISVTVYIRVFRGRCGKTKDEEISIDSKYQEE